MDYDIAGLDEELQIYLMSTQERIANFGPNPLVGRLTVMLDAGPYASVVLFSRAGEKYELAQINIAEQTFSLSKTPSKNDVQDIAVRVLKEFAEYWGLEEEIEEEPIYYNPT